MSRSAARVLWTAACLAAATSAARAQAAIHADSIPALDSAALLHSLSVLSADSMEGRAVNTSGNARARAFIVREFTRIGLQPVRKRFDENFAAPPRSLDPTQPMDGRPCPPPRAGTARFPTPMRCDPPVVRGTNVIGLVKGSRFPDRYIVVSAHFDHLGLRRGELYPGADDNASGSAAVLAIAEWTQGHQPLNSIIFALFDGEEEGMVGSTAFVRDPPVPLDRIAADVNVDMIGHSWKGQLYAAGARRHAVMQPYLDSLRTEALITVLQGHDGEPSMDDWTFRSDQAPFHVQGIPYIHFGNEEHADYHQPTDTFASITPGFYYHAARTVAEFVRLLDRNLDPVAAARAKRK